MNIALREIGPDAYEEYTQLRPGFLVESVLECRLDRDGLGGIVLRQVPVATPYSKYWPDEGPAVWARMHDLTKWGIFIATADHHPAGGAAVASPAPGIVVTEGHKDTAGLFDIRVEPAQRRRGVGTALLRACADWARARGFRFLAIETQNTNVPACRFYAKSGCELVEIRRFGYADCAEVSEEAMLIWRLKL
jgi:ribosomal protein S18 acetylase RimI-like enzyme